MATTESLEAAIQRTGNAVDFLRNSQYPAVEFPVKSEWTNWRSEQLAWRETCVLLDQSHHMANLFVKGPDALKVFSDYGVNSFKNFAPGMAKQYVSTNKDGGFIGDAILFYMDQDYLSLVANASIVNWMEFHATKGGYKVEVTREENSNRRASNPTYYRYEIQGPTSLALVEKLTGGKVPDVKFFHMINFTIAGKKVRALRHGMAGQPGFEFFGPWADGEAVLNAILKIGDEFGLKRGGAKCYATANLESGWMPRPFTAIFGPNEKAFREWLKADAVGSLGGSMDSNNVTDYYHTPYDIGYGKLVNFDHDFLGKEALQKIATGTNRTKVTLEWNADDVAAAMRTWLEPGTPAKFIEFPKSRYAFFQVDKILHKGKYAGMSTDVGFITNEHAFISLASIDASAAAMGTEVTVLWGEKPNSQKPGVEPHRQVEIRATVAPWPFAGVIREKYRKN